MDYCPECGGEMHYIISAKNYVCKSCGILLSHQEILEAREKQKPEDESAEDQHKRERKDYLKWWLSKKK